MQPFAVKKQTQLVQDLVMGKPLELVQLSNLAGSFGINIMSMNVLVEMMEMIKHADQQTYEHSIKTAFYAMLSGKWLGLKTSEVAEVMQAGLLHDLGKVKIPGGILRKDDILSVEEYDILKTHPALGYEMLLDYPEISYDVKQAVLMHHERLDGSGYPFMARSQFINLYARIVAVADTYDSMCSVKLYNHPSGPFAAFEMLGSLGLTVFDQTVVSTFLENISAAFVGTSVVLNSGDAGKIIYIPPWDFFAAVVRTESRVVDLGQNRDLRITRFVV